eukprot:2658993-Rhodomonas_salina.1
MQQCYLPGGFPGFCAFSQVPGGLASIKKASGLRIEARGCAFGVRSRGQQAISAGTRSPPQIY